MLLWTRQGQHGPDGIYIQDVTNDAAAHVDVSVGGQSTDPEVLRCVGVVIKQSGSANAQSMTCPLNVKFTGGSDLTNGAVILRTLNRRRSINRGYARLEV